MPDGPITISGISNSTISLGTAANVTNQVQTSPDGPAQDLDIADPVNAADARSADPRVART